MIRFVPGPSVTTRLCGCTTGACVTCAPRGCPCHDLVAVLGREPSLSDFVSVTPSPPYRLPPPPVAITFSTVPGLPPKRARRRKAAA